MTDKRTCKQTIVKNNLFYCELDKFLSMELAEEGYDGIEIRHGRNIEVIIRATSPQLVLGTHGRRIRELTALIEQRFRVKNLELYTQRVKNRFLSAVAQAELIKRKLEQGRAVRRAAYSVLRSIMDNKAAGCEIIVSGKLRSARAKNMKFKAGYMIKSGSSKSAYVSEAVRHVKMKQGCLGIKVRIQFQTDPNGIVGPKTPLPDKLIIHEPK